MWKLQPAALQSPVLALLGQRTAAEQCWGIKARADGPSPNSEILSKAGAVQLRLDRPDCAAETEAGQPVKGSNIYIGDGVKLSYCMS